MFEKPEQVIFIDNEENDICYGIGIGNIIICGCCGGIFDVDEVSGIDTLEWINLSPTIRGD